MGGNQNGNPKKQPMKASTIALLGAGAVVLAIINMSTGSEAPRQAVAIMQYAFLACGLVGLAAGLVMMMSSQK